MRAVTFAIRSRGAFVAWVLGIYAACRVVSTVVLLLAIQHQVPSGMTGGDDVPVTYFSFTALWDGQWYSRIADGGYPDVLPLNDEGHVAENPWAFYPVFPFVAKVFMTFTGLDFAVVASTLALVCGFGAAAYIGLLLRDRLGDAAALAVVALWASFPSAVVLQLAYTEALAMLLLAGYLYALMRERWLVATGVALLVGLSRPIAVPLAVVTLVAVIVRWRARDARPLRGHEPVQIVAALVGCGAAGFLWPAIAWWRTGVSSAYTDTMSAWRGFRPIEPFMSWFDNARWWLGEPWGTVWLVLTVQLVVLVMVGAWARGLGPALRTWSLAYPAYLFAVQDPHTSTWRYLLPLFPVLAVLIGAGWADRRGNSAARVLIVTVPLLVLCVLGQYWWTDTLWVFNPPSDFPP
jgi:hypothetical protein